MDQKIKVVAYCRFSSEKQVDGYSIEAQKKAILEFCNHNNYELLKFYVDEARSGTNDNREEFQQMISDSNKKLFDAVIVHKLDRFSRDRYNSIFYRKKLKENGVKLISVLERIDDENPEDLILLSVLEGMSEYYSKNLSREVKKGMNIAASKGQWTGGKIPFGYKINKELHQLEIDENQAFIVRIFFKMYAEGNSLKDIENFAYTHKYLTRNGKFFDSKYIGRLLQNELYIGTKTYNTYKHRKGKDYISDTAIIVKNAHEPIIDEETFFKCKTRFDSNSKSKARMCNGHEYLLSGYLFCGECGSAIRGSCAYSKTKNKYYYYKCLGNRNANKKCKLKAIPANDLENLIFTIIKDECFKPTQIKEYANRIVDLIALKEIEYKNSRDAKLSKPIELLKKDLANLEDKKSKLLDLYLESSIDKETYNKKTAELDKLAVKLEYEINEYNSLDFEANNVLTVEVIELALKLMIEDLLSDDASINKKSIIDALIKKIIITEDKIELFLKLSSLSISSDKSQLVSQLTLYTNLSMNAFNNFRLYNKLDPLEFELII